LKILSFPNDFVGCCPTEPLLEKWKGYHLVILLLVWRSVSWSCTTWTKQVELPEKGSKHVSL